MSNVRNCRGCGRRLPASLRKDAVTHNARCRLRAWTRDQRVKADVAAILTGTRETEGFWVEMGRYHRRQARIALLILGPNPRQLAEFQDEMRRMAELCERLATEEVSQ